MKISFKMCIVLFFCLIGTSQAQGWRGIVPLHSTCEDVKRILSIPTCEPTLVELVDATVFINFSDGTCKSEWKVARGTVISLDVRPKIGLRLADLHIDLSKYTRTVDPQVETTLYLKNEDEGISITTFKDDRIRHLFYGPTAKDNALRCDQLSGDAKRKGHGSIKFDEYDFGNFDTETSRLDTFATTLAAWAGSTGYIIVYPGADTNMEQAQVRAAEAKTYLVEKRRIMGNKIVTVIGGLREQPSVELFIMVKDGDPPTPTPLRSPQRLERNPQ